MADEVAAAGRRTEAASPSAGGSAAGAPLVVDGNALVDYDFGPAHPLTPRRFPPAMDLLRASGAVRLLTPRPASDAELERLHTRRYIEAVRAFSDDTGRHPEAGIGPGDCPPFRGMHEASARVAGGSLAAVDALLGGEVEHAFNPGGGLHHAMASRASGFCIYNDVALAVARARDAGHRVLYVDLDVHHGDGTQALFWDDPAVLTVSVHETGLALFPGTGFPDETGGPSAPGSAVNVPLDPYSGDESWLYAVESIVPALADAWRPDVLVTQHGCDSHAYDPLAHLRVTTRGYARVTRLLDGIAHRWCHGRWLATGGGGYAVYRVVPRSWALVWLAQAHRDVPERLPDGWPERWADDADRYGEVPLPDAFLDPADLVGPDHPPLLERNRRTVDRVREQALALLAH